MGERRYGVIRDRPSDKINSARRAEVSMHALSKRTRWPARRALCVRRRRERRGCGVIHRVEVSTPVGTLRFKTNTDNVSGYYDSIERSCVENVGLVVNTVDDEHIYFTPGAVRGSIWKFVPDATGDGSQ